MQLNNDMPKDIDSVSKVVVCWKNRCLLLRRVDGKGWELPGGHLNEGETFMSGAKREVFEETSIKLTKLMVLKKQKDYCLYKAIPKVIKVVLSNEHTKFKWVDKHQLFKTRITQPTKLNLKQILDAIE